MNITHRIKSINAPGQTRSKEAYNYHVGDYLSFFVLSEGFGERSIARKASREIISVISSIFLKLINEGFDISENNIIEAIRLANKSLITNQLDHNVIFWSAIATLLVIREDIAHIANVGNARVYIYRQNHLQQITEDHNLTSHYDKHGEKYRKSTYLRMLTRELGKTQNVSVDLFTVKLKDGDQFLMLTDGMIEAISEREINDLLRQGNIENVSKTLEDRFLRSKVEDDASFAAIKYQANPNKQIQRPPITERVLPLIAPVVKKKEREKEQQVRSEDDIVIEKRGSSRQAVKEVQEEREPAPLPYITPPVYERVDVNRLQKNKDRKYSLNVNPSPGWREKLPPLEDNELTEKQPMDLGEDEEDVEVFRDEDNIDEDKTIRIERQSSTHKHSPVHEDRDEQNKQTRISKEELEEWFGEFEDEEEEERLSPVEFKRSSNVQRNTERRETTPVFHAPSHERKPVSRGLQKDFINITSASSPFKIRVVFPSKPPDTFWARFQKRVRGLRAYYKRRKRHK